MFKAKNMPSTKPLELLGLPHPIQIIFAIYTEKIAHYNKAPI